jgi:ribosomal protein S14
MLSKKIKDIRIRESFYKIEKLKRLKKFVFINLLNKTKQKSSLLRNFFLIFFSKSKQNMPNKSRVRMTNRCVINNRNRGVLRSHSISRTLLRNLMQFGIIPGFSKAVW